MSISTFPKDIKDISIEPLDFHRSYLFIVLYTQPKVLIIDSSWCSIVINYFICYLRERKKEREKT